MNTLKILLCACIFLQACQADSAQKKIGIQAFGEFDAPLIARISDNLIESYGCTVYKLEPSTLPTSAMVAIKTPRYRADSLLRFLGKIKPDTLDHILGLCHQDISCTKKDANGNILKPESKYTDWGIFGLGQTPGVACIVSDFRLTPKRGTLYYERLEKITVHEIGHTYGLPHCKNKTCVMTDAAESISTIDNVLGALCEKCKSKIGLN